MVAIHKKHLSFVGPADVRGTSLPYAASSVGTPPRRPSRPSDAFARTGGRFGGPPYPTPPSSVGTPPEASSSATCSSPDRGRFENRPTLPRLCD
jgi:hypothetical protein